MPTLLSSAVAITPIEADGMIDESQLAAAAFLARYGERTLDAYRDDLRSYFQWAADADLDVLTVTRSPLETSTHQQRPGDDCPAGSTAGGPPETYHQFFLVQNEKARPDGEEFDTLSIMASTRPQVALGPQLRGPRLLPSPRTSASTASAGRPSVDHGRAMITFSDDHRTQTHVWKWRPEETWLSLCDRTATRTD